MSFCVRWPFGSNTTWNSHLRPNRHSLRERTPPFNQTERVRCAGKFEHVHLPRRTTSGRFAISEFLTDHNYLTSLERQCLTYTSKQYDSFSAVRKNTSDGQTVKKMRRTANTTWNSHLRPNRHSLRERTPPFNQTERVRCAGKFEHVHLPMESPSEEELRVIVLQFITDHNHLTSLERQCLTYTSKQYDSFLAVGKNASDVQTVLL